MSDNTYINIDDELVYNKIDISCEIHTHNETGAVKVVLQYINLPSMEVAKTLAQKLYTPSRELVEQAVRENFEYVKIVDSNEITEISKDAKFIPIREVSTKLQ